MLDMYSDTSIGLTGLLPGHRLRDACPYFDGTGYVREIRPVDPYRTQFKVIWSGGPMERVFGVDSGWLAKVSLMYWNPETWYWNPHVAFPFERNLGTLTGVHLHFKFLSDFAANVIREVHRNQHADNASGSPRSSSGIVASNHTLTGASAG